MAGNPLVDQGQILRLRASIVFVTNPTLNIISSFLGKEGINIVLEGEASELLDTMTGVAPSPGLYQRAMVEADLLKSQSFSDLWKRTIEVNSLVGDFIVRPDATTLSPYYIRNGVAATTAPGRQNGSAVDFGL